eukprot:gene8324-148_t
MLKPFKFLIRNCYVSLFGIEILGFGETPLEAMKSFRCCFEYYYGKDSWNQLHGYTKTNVTTPKEFKCIYEKHWINKDGKIHEIKWEESVHFYKCYI